MIRIFLTAIRSLAFLRRAAALRAALVMAALGTISNADAQIILVLADGLNYTFKVPKTQLVTSETRVDKVLVRVGVDAEATDPILEFSGNELAEDRQFTRSVDESLRGQRFRIHITRLRIDQGVPGAETVIRTVDFVVGQTLGTIFEDTVWDSDRQIEGASLAVLLRGGVHVPVGVTLTIRGGAVIDGFEPQGATNHKKRSPFLVDGTLIVENATLKNLLVNTESLFSLKRSAPEQIRISHSTLENVELDAHMSGTESLLNVKSTITDSSFWILRPFGSAGDLVVQNCEFAHRVEVRPARFEGPVPGKLVFQANQIGIEPAPPFGRRTLVIEAVPADVEISGNTFRSGGVRLTSGDGRGFVIGTNTAREVGKFPSNNNDPSEDFTIEIAQEGDKGATPRRIVGNQGVAEIDLHADGVDVLNNLITIPTLQGRSGSSEGVFLVGSDCVIENNTLRGPFGDQDGTEGILIGARRVADFRNGENAPVSGNRIAGNTISGWQGGGILLVSGENNIIRDNVLEFNGPNLALGENSSASPDDAAPGAGNVFTNNQLRNPLSRDLPFNFRAQGVCAIRFCPVDLDRNLWSDYSGPDANRDGVGDVPHELGAVGADRYRDNFPLLEAEDPDDIVVNITTDQPDADLDDGVADVDLQTPGLQTSLRAAIQTANANSGPDVILFDFTAGGPTTGAAILRPLSPLPAIIEEVLVDATAVAGGFQIDGGSLPRPNPGTGPDGLQVKAPSGVVLRGLAVVAFHRGIAIEGGEKHRVERCLLGVTRDLVSPALGNQIGLAVIGAREVSVSECVVGNSTGEGILLDRATAGEIRGCRIGVVAGPAAVPNRVGILLQDSLGCLVGGSNPEDANVIVASPDVGVAVVGPAVPGTAHTVRGNFIGALDADSDDRRFANGDGVRLEDTARHQVENNRIAFNRLTGVLAELTLRQPAGVVLEAVLIDNSISRNGGLGFSTELFGPNPGRTPELAFETPEEGQPFRRDRLVGKFRTEPNRRVRFQVFSNTECDDSSYGEGEFPMTTVDASADVDGLAVFSVDIPPAHQGRFHTALATRLSPGGEPEATSEFSQCLGAIIVNLSTDEPDPTPGDGIADIDPDREGLQTTLRAAIQTANALPGRDVILFEVPMVEAIAELPEIREEVSIVGSGVGVQLFGVGRTLVFGLGGDDSLCSKLSIRQNQIDVGIDVVGARNVTVDECLFFNTNPGSPTQVGVLVRDGGSVRVTNSRFTDFQGTSVRIEDSPGSIVGGETLGDGVSVPEGNHFSGFGTAVEIRGSAATDVEISHNRLGPGVNRPAAGSTGVVLRDAPGNRVLGNSIISIERPIQIAGAGSRSNLVQRNLVELKLAMPALARVAVMLTEGASDNRIGSALGQSPEAGNQFADFPVGIGVVSGLGNALLGNQYLRGDPAAPRAFPIDLGFDPALGPRPTPNDTDPGVPTLPNRHQNHPEIDFVSHDGRVVLGQLKSTPGETFVVELLGQLGEVVLARQEVTTFLDGSAVFRFQLAEPATGLLATATDRFGNTSETSPAVVFYSVNSPLGGMNTTDNQVGDGFNFTGSNLPDGSPECSLRAAIEDANAYLKGAINTRALVHYQIFFDGFPNRIRLREERLPTVSVPMTLGAELDPGLVELFRTGFALPPEIFRFNPFLDLDGSELRDPEDRNVALIGRSVFGGGLHVRHLGVSGFAGTLDGQGVLQFEDSPGSRVEACRVTGNGPGGSGIVVTTSPGVAIRDSLISDNRLDGIVVAGSPGVLIENNVIGMTDTGIPSGNRDGILVSDTQAEGRPGVIRGNRIGGNRGNGIVLLRSGGQIVAGNRVGLFSEAQLAGNGFNGIVLRGDSKGNVIGGEGEGDGNLIVDNARNGIVFTDEGVTQTSVLGNVVGDPAGGVIRLNRGNREAGILIERSSGNQIGGPGRAGNRVVHNGINGIEIRGANSESTATGNRVQGNTIEGNLGAGLVLDFADGNLIGPAPDQGIEFANVFAGGHDPAIRVLTADDNAISRNSIFENLGGIRLESGAASHEDIRPPRITQVIHDGLNLRVRVLFEAAKSANYTFELFENPGDRPTSPDCGLQAGRRFLASETVPLQSGVRRPEFFFQHPNPSETSLLTLTVTGLGMGTSEFSKCHPIVPFDSDGDGTPDPVEESLNPGSSTDASVSAVPGFGPDGQARGFLGLNADPVAAGGVARFTSTAGFPLDRALVPPPPGVEFPIGAFSFNLDVGVPGASAVVRLKVPADLKANCLFKLARRTPGGPPEWFCLPEDSFNVSFDFDRNEWIFRLTDGQLGDFDLVTDAIIRDPFAPAFDPALPPLGGDSVRLSVVRAADGSIEIGLTAVPGTRHQLQRADGMATPVDWRDLGGVATTPADGTVIFREATGPGAGFYRVMKVE